MPYLQQTQEPSRPMEENNLYSPGKDGSERSDYREQHVFERSLYTQARLHPLATGLTALGVAAVAAAAMRRGSKRRGRIAGSLRRSGVTAAALMRR